MKKLTSIIILLFLFIPLFSQEDNEQIEWKRLDHLRYFEEEVITLRFIDALTGKMLADGKLDIGDDMHIEAEPDGCFFIPVIPDGKYNMVFKKQGYIDTELTLDVLFEVVFHNIYAISPQLEFNQVRIVLDWGETPKDLDLHLIKKDAYHVSYRKMKVSEDGEAMLDRDDTNSYGPETITIQEIDQNASYLVKVHDYTNRDKSYTSELSNSEATIKVYSHNSLLNKYKIKRNTKGKNWIVFFIEDGKIIDAERIKD